MNDEAVMAEMKNLLREGKYDDAKKVCSNTPRETIRTILFDLADEIGLPSYNFALYLYNKSKDEYWMDCVISLLIHLCYIEGAYSMALFYSREQLARDYTAENLDMILFYHDIPEKLVSQEEAIEIAKQLIVLDPANVHAKSILGIKQ